MSGKTIDRLFNEKGLRPDFAELATPLVANEFVLLKDETDPDHTALGRFRGKSRAPCRRCGAAAARRSGSWGGTSSRRWQPNCCSTTR